MTASRIYNRQIKGLDTGVWLLMIIMMILSLGLLSFMWFNSNKCVPFTIKFSPNSDTVYYTGNTIFLDISVPAKKLTWDYGDDSDPSGDMFHKYARAGKYLITADNSGCEESREITILTNPNEDNSEGNIIGPQSVSAGKEAEFSCTKFAKSYDWEVVNHAEIRAKTGGEFGEKASFSFTKNGNYTIQVKLDGNRVKSFIREISVSGGIEKPKTEDKIKKLIDDPVPVIKPQPVPEPVTVKPIKIPIVESQFRDKLRNVLEENSTLQPESFDKYLDLGIEGTKVIMNGQKMSFRAMFNKIAGQHNAMNIESVQYRMDPENKKILVLLIKTN